jgi:acyl transferase domain-containing protein/acyl carrier protein
MEVAIVGMACRFPGAPDWRTFWHNLCNGVESVSFFDSSADALPGFIGAAATLDKKEFFDSSFFGYTPEEAALMNPAHRAFHECVWTALEDAGYNVDTVASHTGLYAGAGDDLNWKVYSTVQGARQEFDPFALSHINSKEYLASLIAYRLNFRGSSFFIHTACSTSLVAVNAACKALLLGDVKMAVAGGVSIMTNTVKGYYHQEGMINSADGHCRAFDAASSGTISGEGAGVVVLKRLTDALKDGDHIYSVIKGSAVNSDGGDKSAFAAPGIEGQSACIRKALNISKVERNSIGYIEAHGTATRLGDAIEIEALNIAFNRDTSHRCAIGTVKSNVGHLDAAAGVAGLIKASLCLKFGKLVPSLHYQTPNPEINFKGGPFYVNTVLTDWNRSGDYPLRAGVSSFGIGGTNAHVILEEPPVTDPDIAVEDTNVVLLSAKTPAALLRYANQLEQFVQDADTLSLSNLSYTLLTGRKYFKYRKALVFTAKEELIALLKGLPVGELTQSSEREKPVVLMFSGAGSQYVNMGKGLYECFPVFREEMDRGFQALFQLTGVDYSRIFYPDNEDSRLINEMLHTQPAIFLFGVSLARLIISQGIQPAMMIGHSIGEYISAYLSGVFSYDDALKLVVARGRLMDSIGGGMMVSVSLSESECQQYLNNTVALAAVNSPGQVVLSGSLTAMTDLMLQLDKDEVVYVKLYASKAGHSDMIEQIMPAYRAILHEVAFSSPRVPFVSNLTGKVIEPSEAVSVDYWVSHMRHTVRFSEGIDLLLKHPAAFTFIEVGAGHSLSTLLRQHTAQRGKISVFSLVRHPKEDEEDFRYFLSNLGRIWESGQPVDLNGLHKEKHSKRISIPTYSFEQIPYPVEVDPFRELGSGAGLFSRKGGNPADYFYRIQWKTSFWLPVGEPDFKDEHVLVFMQDTPHDTRLVQSLEDIGALCIRIEHGPRFMKTDTRHYILNPTSESDYETLFAALRSDGFHPRHLIHTWLYSSGIEDENYSYPAYLDLGYKSLQRIIRSFALYYPANLLNISLVADGLYRVHGNEVITPAKAAALAPVKIIPKEFENVRCRAIDIPTVEDALSARSLITELSAAITEVEVAIRYRQRFVKDLGKIDNIHTEHITMPFRKDGVYLLTGANGAMAQVFASYLAENFKAALVLIGRSPLDESSRRHMINAGISFFYIEADISDYEKVHVGITAAEAQLGKIDAVLHTAGVIDKGGMIMRRSESDDIPVFSSKIAGTEVLRAVFQNRQLDFFVLSSSLAATLAPFGEVAYVAANLYEDAVAEQMSVDYPVISIQWNTIKDAGAAVKSVSHLSMAEQQRMLKSGISSAELVDVLKIALYLNIPTPVISTWDLRNAAMDAGTEAPELFKTGVQAVTNRERPELLNEYMSATTTTEQSVIAIIENYLGINGIGVEDNLFELGMDSLKAMMLGKRIEKELGVLFTVKDFFLHKCARKLAAEIDLSAWLNKPSTREIVSII